MNIWMLVYSLASKSRSFEKNAKDHGTHNKTVSPGNVAGDMLGQGTRIW